MKMSERNFLQQFLSLIFITPFLFTSLEAGKEAEHYIRGSLNDLQAETCADGIPTFADGERDAFLQCNRLAQFHGYFNGIARHNHIHALRQPDRSRYVGSAHVELRLIAAEEGSVTTALLSGERVDLRREGRMWLD